MGAHVRYLYHLQMLLALAGILVAASFQRLIQVKELAVVIPPS